MEQKTEKLTDEQLYLLCEEYEKKLKKKKEAIKNDSRDKGIDYEYMAFWFEKSKDLK